MDCWHKRATAYSAFPLLKKAFVYLLIMVGIHVKVCMTSKRRENPSVYAKKTVQLSVRVHTT